MNHLNIRKLTLQDREDFLSMICDLYSSGAALHFLSKEDAERIFALSCKESPYYQAFIIEYQGRVAGYMHLSFTHSNEALGMVLLIEELYIKKEFRSLGIGKEVLSWLKKEYREDVRRFRLELTAQNDRAKRLYEKMGFQELPYTQMIWEESK